MRFSPLAGIRYSETVSGIEPERQAYLSAVSVPLRGLDIQKLSRRTKNFIAVLNCFSPLAGIRYSETLRLFSLVFP